ncbi:DUF4245 domain-containing protein [Phytomonospora sp. NPDC050363]|uniref:DUF4245 domain-containing protein n=1 Tax=Phytomonospora sp. NPDC050363 TaxID=3155642 RepID=UPI0033D4B8FE
MSSTYTAPRRPRDMILSLAVILVPIALILGGWRLLFGGSDVNAIDPAPKYQEAADAGLAVVRPQGLPEEWLATQAAVNRQDGAVTLRVAYQTPDGSGVQLVESSAESATLLAAELGEGPRLEGNVEAGGEAWMSYLTRDGNVALVWPDDLRTVIVIGDADQGELLELATSLK